MLSLAGIGLASPMAMAARVEPTYNIAFVDYGTPNTYVAPIGTAMIAAAAAWAKASSATNAHVKVTVQNGEFTPSVQSSLVQSDYQSGQYQGIIVEPIYGPALVGNVKASIAANVPVVNVDQILGSDWTSDQEQVPGLSGNVVFWPSKIGTQLGGQARLACLSAGRDTAGHVCNIVLVHNFAGEEPDAAITSSFNASVATQKYESIIDTTGDGKYTPSVAETYMAGALVAHPNIDVVVSSDQDCEGAQTALSNVSNTHVKLVCYGASEYGINAVKSGAWFSDVAQAPVTEGTYALNDMVKALETGKNQGSQNPVAGLPSGGIVTKADYAAFSNQWPG